VTPLDLAGFEPAGAGSGLLLAALLGLRHATDPDHLAAVATLAADPAGGGARAATRLGVAWGLGHAATCFCLGAGAVWAGSALPPVARQAAELAIGLMIVGLAVRLLRRWMRGELHSHAHRHDGLEHSHPHLHEPRPARHHADGHRHRHAEGLGRSPREAFGIGLVHGVGGSALAAALLVAAAGDTGRALVLLGAFGVGSVVAMAGISGALGLAFDRAPRALAVERAVPVLGVTTLAFGAWYAMAALEQLLARA
jgi:hypothetical protein